MIANMQPGSGMVDHELLAIALHNVRNMPEPEFWDKGIYEGVPHPGSLDDRPDLDPNNISAFNFGCEENDYDYAYLSDPEDPKPEYRPAAPLPPDTDPGDGPKTSGVILRRNISAPNPENCRGPVPMPRRKRSKKVTGACVRRSLSAPNSANYRIGSKPIPIPGREKQEDEEGSFSKSFKNDGTSLRRENSDPFSRHFRGPMPLPGEEGSGEISPDMGKYSKSCSGTLRRRPPAPLPGGVREQLITPWSPPLIKDFTGSQKSDEGDYDYADLNQTEELQVGVKVHCHPKYIASYCILNTVMIYYFTRFIPRLFLDIIINLSQFTGVESNSQNLSLRKSEI